ncbi:hypothetical protein E2C01_015067 [Portunus trituberculatus]|uniref:Uncharacterized protein n=1 Tax=Portunus trituberculatus TaxID=210409 RepID=A0A5B7DKC2_PORTR|nr:hypothetical protein [Portunus trituberculatus]
MNSPLCFTIGWPALNEGRTPAPLVRHVCARRGVSVKVTPTLAWASCKLCLPLSNTSTADPSLLAPHRPHNTPVVEETPGS